jgi:predicted CXXCH cytochrome family protein
MLKKKIQGKLKISRQILSAIPVIFFLIYLSGCSITHNYKALSFFFDGVPDPAKKSANSLNDSISRPDSLAIAQNTLGKTGPQMIVHPPYQDKQCGSCHDQSTMGKLIKTPPALCYQCHEDFNDKYKIVHGPVGGGYCTQCHNPHMSNTKDLLIRTGQTLCFHCHDTQQIAETEAHRTIKDTDCSECHNPHGGDNRNFLR